MEEPPTAAISHPSEGLHVLTEVVFSSPLTHSLLFSDCMSQISASACRGTRENRTAILFMAGGWRSPRAHQPRSCVRRLQTQPASAAVMEPRPAAPTRLRGSDQGSRCALSTHTGQVRSPGRSAAAGNRLGTRRGSAGHDRGRCVAPLSSATGPGRPPLPLDCPLLSSPPSSAQDVPALSTHCVGPAVPKGQGDSGCNRSAVGAGEQARTCRT